jgi:parvulin-like peptidyl-prolyl isomerase
MTPAQRNAVVARVGDSALTLCDFAQRINMQNQYLRARFQAPEQRRALLRSWVDSELLATEARNRGLDRDPSVQHSITSQLARQLETDLRAAVPQPEVADADVEQYFNAHRAEYDTPEQVRAAHIVVSNRTRAEQLLAEARAHGPADEGFWRDLVRRETTDTVTRDTGGDLGFFGAQGGVTVPQEVATAAFGLHQPGEIAATVIASAHGGPNHGPGFHVLRFISRRDAMHRSLEDVRRAIRNRLWRERFDRAQGEAVRNLVTQLRSRTQVSIDENALQQLHLDLTPAPPQAPPTLTPAMPNAPAAPVPASR